MVSIMTNLLARNSISRWLIWEDHSLLSYLTAKNIQCHLLSWKIQIASYKQQCPLVSMLEVIFFYCYLEGIKSPFKYNIVPLY